MKKTIIAEFLVFFSVLFFTNMLFAKGSSGFVPKVDVFKVGNYHNIPVYAEYPARTLPFAQVTVVARVEGVLKEKFFNEGEYVNKGDILYAIEPDIYSAQVKTALANLDISKKKLADAEKRWKRIEALYKDNVTSEENRDNAYYTYKIAESNVALAKAQLEKAEIILNYTKVIAPINGYTGIKLIDTGSVVKNGTPLVTITEIKKIYALFSVPDSDAAKYNFTNMVKKLTPELVVNGKTFAEGKLDFSDVKIDQQTSSLKMRAIFENREGNILPGEFVRVKLKGIVLKKMLEVPQKAVLQNEFGKIVFLVKKGKVVPAPVVTGESTGGNFIVKKGLKPGDLVIINNFFKIKPNSRVKIDKIIK
jgi:membrane fusion protein (multidrug efflux system)